MNCYQAFIDCERCGGVLQHVAGCRIEAKSYGSAIARCGQCGQEYQVTVTVRKLGRFSSVPEAAA